MIQEFYNMNKKFYKEIEQEFGVFGFGKYEWESLHLCYLVYYMTQYAIQNRECFSRIDSVDVVNPAFEKVFKTFRNFKNLKTKILIALNIKREKTHLKLSRC